MRGTTRDNEGIKGLKYSSFIKTGSSPSRVYFHFLNRQHLIQKNSFKLLQLLLSMLDHSRTSSPLLMDHICLLSRPLRPGVRRTFACNDRRRSAGVVNTRHSDISREAINVLDTCGGSGMN